MLNINNMIFIFKGEKLKNILHIYFNFPKFTFLYYINAYLLTNTISKKIDQHI